MTTVLVLGGARSGKSAYAERLLAGREAVTYVAPGPVPGHGDSEWAARVRAHRTRRPAAWTTLETADVPGALADAGPGAALLVDCLGTWLTRLVDDARAWDDAGRARAEIGAGIRRLVASVEQTRADVVLVSNEVGSGVVPATASGRVFRDGLGRANAAVADVADHAALVVAGRVLDLTGAPRLDDAPRFGLS